MNRVYKSIPIVGVMVLILASAGCAELPPEDESGWSGVLSPSESPTPSAEGDYDPEYLMPATPYPTATSDMAKPTLSKPPETAPASDTYVTIYNRTTQFTQTTEAFSFDLTTPPLIIDFRVEPKMITRDKYATSDYGSKADGVFKQTYPSENAWFKVTVRDRESGKIVAEEGFGKLYSADTHKEVFMGRAGNYLIELAGNDVKVHVLMRVGGV